MDVREGFFEAIRFVKKCQKPEDGMMRGGKEEGWLRGEVKGGKEEERRRREEEGEEEG
jgi:hypothetical protein